MKCDIEKLWDNPREIGTGKNSHTYIYICICINMYVYVYLDMLMNVNNVESCVHIYILYLVLESIVELLKTLMCS